MNFAVPFIRTSYLFIYTFKKMADMKDSFGLEFRHVE